MERTMNDRNSAKLHADPTWPNVWQTYDDDGQYERRGHLAVRDDGVVVLVPDRVDRAPRP